MAEASGLPVHYILDDQQVGRSFAERFTNAFQQLFRQGYDKVIAIGNDHPGLTSGHLQTAAWELAEYDHVLGPSTDGGFYLIGVWQKRFQQLPFETLSGPQGGFKDPLPGLSGSAWSKAAFPVAEESAPEAFFRA